MRWKEYRGVTLTEMVQNDIAYIVEKDGGYTIRLRETVTNRHKLNTEEAICMLALFSSFMREKGVKKIDSSM